MRRLGQAMFRNDLGRMVVVTLGVVTLTVACAAVVLLLAGHSPLAAWSAVYQGVFARPDNLARSLEDVAPLLLCGLAAGIAFRAGVLNIGGQGQYLLGAVAFIAIGTTLRPPGPSWLILILGGVAAMIAGAAWALIAGLLERWRGINEVLSTILLNFIAIAVVSWLVQHPLGDPDTSAPQTASLAPADRLPRLVPLTRFHVGIPFAIALACLLWLIQARTRFGFELRMLGANPGAAQALGIAAATRRLQIYACSGALAGLGGALQTAGVTWFLSEATRSFGYLGVAVALLGALHPLGIIASAIFFALLDGSARAMEQRLDVPRDLADLLKGVALVTALLGAAWIARARRRQAEPSESATPPAPITERRP